MKIHHKKVIVLLEPISELCTERNLPHLTYLAVNGKSELPEVLKKESDADVKFTEEKAKIYAFNWHTIANPFMDENSKTDISGQAAPVLPLEDLSSKEPVADYMYRNKPIDEALKPEIPVIENGNGITADSEGNKDMKRKRFFISLYRMV